MSRMGELDMEQLSRWLDTLEPELARAQSLQEAAQHFTRQTHERFHESLALVRLFATVPHGRLPARDRYFVEQLAAAQGQRALLRPGTPVLSLLGTSGKLPEWNERYASRGHLGIPLVSAAFVDSIPMVSRLLKDLGLPLHWLADGGGSLRGEQSLGRLLGTFYVREALGAVDEQGRHIISSTQFVQEHGVCTVFGMGGGYVAHEAVLVAIFFSRERLERHQVEPLSALVSMLKSATTELVSTQRLYPPEALGPG
jgi:hypothetical protein